MVAWFLARSDDTGAGTRATVRLMARTFVIAVLGLNLPFVIRAAVVVTATEVSTVGVVYTALLGLLVYRQFDWRRIYPILVDTISLTGAIMLIIGTATADGLGIDLIRVLPVARLGDSWGAGRDRSVSRNRDHCFHHSGQRPRRAAGHSPVWPVAVSGGQGDGRARGALRNDRHPGEGIGLFAPPFGVGYYGACAIGRVSPDDALWRIWPYIGALVVALAIVAAIPWISIGFL